MLPSKRKSALYFPQSLAAKGKYRTPQNMKIITVSDANPQAPAANNGSPPQFSATNQLYKPRHRGECAWGERLRLPAGRETTLPAGFRQRVTIYLCAPCAAHFSLTSQEVSLNA